MTDKQPEPLRLARELEGVYPVNIQDQEAAASELRRLHAENALLHYTLTAYVGVSEALAEEQTENDLLESRCGNLLKALKACLEKGSRWHPCDPVVIQAKSAIAKAEGKKQ